MSYLVPVNPRSLTRAQYGQLADVPPELEWLAKPRAYFSERPPSLAVSPAVDHVDRAERSQHLLLPFQSTGFRITNAKTRRRQSGGWRQAADVQCVQWQRRQHAGSLTPGLLLHSKPLFPIAQPYRRYREYSLQPHQAPVPDRAPAQKRPLADRPVWHRRVLVNGHRNSYCAKPLPPA